MYESIESKILDIVEGVIFKRVTPDEPLLESGLVDSIAAVDLALQVESELGIEIPAEKIHEHLRTARSLASYVLATHR